MAKKQYDCREVSIPHGELVKLRNSGKLELGISNEIAQKISSSPNIGPKTTSSAAYHFWNWVVLIGLGYTIYLSLSEAWWWFLVGIFGATIVYRANKSANAKNVLDGAFLDSDFYERVRRVDGWLYLIDDEVACKYKRVETQ